MSRSTLQIYKHVSPETPRPYRVIETYITSEGHRSRICSGVFSTQEDAEIWREQLVQGQSA